MSRKYERELLVERGIVGLTQVERMCYKLMDYLNERNDRLLFNYKNNGNFEILGEENSFKARFKISPELIQDLYVYTPLDAESELLSLLYEHIEKEAFDSVAKKIIENYTSLKSLLLEKVINSTLTYGKVNCKSLFRTILRNFNKKEYIFVVSAEIGAILDEQSNFYVKTSKDYNELEKFSLGLEVLGYLGDSIKDGMKVLRDPYLPAKKCFIVKDIRDTEFFVDFNTSEITTNPNDFTPYYENHIIHVNTPIEMKYQSFEVNEIEPYAN